MNELGKPTRAVEPADEKARLIGEIYEVVLKPERYDQFMQLWESYLSQKVARAGASGFEQVDDPELEDHFKRAYDILEKMGREARDPKSPEKYVAARSEPALLMAANGEVLHQNEPAKAVFGAMPGISALTTLMSQEEMSRLKTILLGLDRPDASEELTVVHISLPSGDASNTPNRELFLARPIRFGRDDPPLLFLGVLKSDWGKPLERVLSRQFELTPSEIAVARDLCAGQSLNEIAQGKGRSVHTLRAQLKSILQKTGTSSQPDLVRLVITMAMLGVRGDYLPAGPAPELDAGRQVLVNMPDGRQMPVHLVGAEDGRPVIFCHGMLDGPAIDARVAAMLRKRNIKLVAPVRPHFGTSPPAYDIATAPDEFAEDVRHIMNRLDIKSAPVVGHKAGAMYAFAVAGCLGELISGILIVSGGIPIVSVRQISDMAPRQRIVAWTARFTPRLLPVILRAGISQIDRGDESDFMNSLYPEGTHDRDVIADPAVRAAIIDGYRFAVAQGHRAFEVDSWHVTRDWSRFVGMTSQPAMLLHGVHEQVISVESARAFADRHANLELQALEDAGQLVFYEKPKIVLSALEEMLG